MLKPEWQDIYHINNTITIFVTFTCFAFEYTYIITYIICSEGKMNRRNFLSITSMSAIGLIIGGRVMASDELIKALKLSDKEWKEKLTDQQYNILREEGTERPFSSELYEEKREGIFACAGCDLELFKSSMKYNSGTGWPSFFDAIPGRLETKSDFQIGMQRTEYHCARCGGHHGHVFKDGPKPTGLRYCNNGAVLKFIPKA